MRLKSFPQKCGHRVKKNGSSQLNMGKFEKNIGSSTWVNVEKDEYKPYKTAKSEKILQK